MQRPGAPPSAARQWQALSEHPGGELRACPQVAAVSATPARATGAAAVTTAVSANANADADAIAIAIAIAITISK
jgi:O6-methylguanine-DNA--protein-cysteine methyltransferase